MILQVFGGEQRPYPYSTVDPNFVGVRLGLDRRRWGSEERRPHPKLIARVIIFEVARLI